MILSKSPCRIVGLRTGEVQIDALRQSQVIIRAEFMLLNDQGDATGRVTRDRDWSEKTRKALEVFVSALEEDVFPQLFQGKATDAEPEAVAEPQQF